MTKIPQFYIQIVTLSNVLTKLLGLTFSAGIPSFFNAQPKYDVAGLPRTTVVTLHAYYQKRTAESIHSTNYSLRKGLHSCGIL